MLKRFNRWYDGLQEPWRFLFFLVILMGWVPLMYTASTTAYVIGGVWMTITCVIALTRLR